MGQVVKKDMSMVPYASAVRRSKPDFAQEAGAISKYIANLGKDH